MGRMGKKKDKQGVTPGLREFSKSSREKVRVNQAPG